MSRGNFEAVWDLKWNHPLGGACEWELALHNTPGEESPAEHSVSFPTRKFFKKKKDTYITQTH